MVEAGDTLLTPGEAAERLGVSERTVRRLASRGELTPIRQGRETRYRATEVDRLAAGDGQAVGDEASAGVAGQAFTSPATASGDSGQEDRANADTGQLRTNTQEEEAGALAVAVDALREALRTAHDDNRRLQDELGAARQEATEKAEAAGLWQGRARTLEERLRQLEPGPLPGEQPAEAQPPGPDITAGERRLANAATVTRTEPPSRWARLRRAWRGQAEGE